MQFLLPCCLVVLCLALASARSIPAPSESAADVIRIRRSPQVAPAAVGGVVASDSTSTRATTLKTVKPRKPRGRGLVHNYGPRHSKRL